MPSRPKTHPSADCEELFEERSSPNGGVASSTTLKTKTGGTTKRYHKLEYTPNMHPQTREKLHPLFFLVREFGKHPKPLWVLQHLAAENHKIFFVYFADNVYKFTLLLDIDIKNTKELKEKAALILGEIFTGDLKAELEHFDWSKAFTLLQAVLDGDKTLIQAIFDDKDVDIEDPETFRPPPFPKPLTVTQTHQSALEVDTAAQTQQPAAIPAAAAALSSTDTVPQASSAAAPASSVNSTNDENPLLTELVKSHTGLSTVFKSFMEEQGKTNSSLKSIVAKHDGDIAKHAGEIVQIKETVGNIEDSVDDLNHARLIADEKSAATEKKITRRMKKIEEDQEYFQARYERKFRTERKKRKVVERQLRLAQTERKDPFEYFHDAKQSESDSEDDDSVKKMLSFDSNDSDSSDEDSCAQQQQEESEFYHYEEDADDDSFNARSSRRASITPQQSAFCKQSGTTMFARLQEEDGVVKKSREESRKLSSKKVAGKFMKTQQQYTSDAEERAEKRRARLSLGKPTAP